MGTLSTLATFVITSGLLSLSCLLVLHFVSREYHPGWRMVSEYAAGKHKWLLTLFFVLWSISSVLSACLLWNIVTGAWASIGAALLFISGIGALMGGLFDMKHKLHGMAFMLGIPTLPIGALIVSYHLTGDPRWAAYGTSLLLAAHSTWISVLLMGLSMALIFSGFKKAGITWDQDSEPPAKLPEGVIGVNGYANRLLIICYIGWLLCLAKAYLAVQANAL